MVTLTWNGSQATVNVVAMVMHVTVTLRAACWLAVEPEPALPCPIWTRNPTAAHQSRSLMKRLHKTIRKTVMIYCTVRCVHSVYDPAPSTSCYCVKCPWNVLLSIITLLHYFSAIRGAASRVTSTQSAKIEHVVPDRQTNRHTRRHTHHYTALLCRGRSNNNIIIIIFIHLSANNSTNML